MIKWITSKVQSLVFITAIASSLIGGLFLWGKGKVKDFKHARKLKNANKDNVIAMEPNKSKPALIEWLRRISK